VIPRTRTLHKPAILVVRAPANWLPNDVKAASAAGSACDLRLFEPRLSRPRIPAHGVGRYPAATSSAFGVPLGAHFDLDTGP
jgi:hypothetical protein